MSALALAPARVPVTSAPPRRSAEEDRLLALASSGGDGQAFALLVEAYERPLYHFTFRMLRDREEAADATQEAFVKAYRGLRTFRPEFRFSTWLFAIAHHTCCDRLNRSRRMPLADQPDHPEPPDAASGPEDEAIRSDQRSRLLAAIADLPERYREAITLFYLRDRSYEEVAEILGLPLGTVKTHLHRAKVRLRRLLESGEPA